MLAIYALSIMRYVDKTHSFWKDRMTSVSKVHSRFDDSMRYMYYKTKYSRSYTLWQ
jgi:hypothetical protein